MKEHQGKSKGNGEATARLAAAARRWRMVHIVSGFLVGVWLLMMAITGVLINHQTAWSLDEVEIHNRYLPAHYSDEFHGTTTRLHVIVADLHSGRFFAANGRLISDLAGLLLFISVCSGFYSYWLRRRANHVGQHANGTAVLHPGRPRLAADESKVGDGEPGLSDRELEDKTLRVH
ncbi:MAG: hypothetical protein ACE5IP_00010 [Terriglobia bacterium]